MQQKRKSKRLIGRGVGEEWKGIEIGDANKEIQEKPGWCGSVD